jgi:hypothetical protein
MRVMMGVMMRGMVMHPVVSAVMHTVRPALGQCKTNRSKRKHCQQKDFFHGNLVHIF